MNSHIVTLVGLAHIEKTRAYLDYLEQHFNNIARAWSEVQEKCNDMHFISDDYIFWWIDREIRSHDLSKFSEEEFVAYREHFHPVSGDRSSDMSAAWEHHKDNNPHHWENWTNKSYYDPYEWKVHCVHMIVDWMAKGYEFGDYAHQYYASNQSRMDLPDYANEFINEIFERVYSRSD